MNDMDDKLIQAAEVAGFRVVRFNDVDAYACDDEGKDITPKLAAYRSAILADAAKDVKPWAWSVTCDGEHVNNIHTSEIEANRGKRNLDRDFQDHTREVVPLVPASTLAAAQALNAELVARVEGLEKDAALQWPKQRRVGRREDMSPDGFMVVGLDSDNDVYIAVTPSEQGYRTGIEFCNGGGGGGSSMRTREALINLMTAIEADNASRPDKAFPPVDAAIAARSGT